MLINNGAAAGQVIFHVRFSVFSLLLLLILRNHTFNSQIVKFNLFSYKTCSFQTHMHIIPRKAYDSLWASEVMFHFHLMFDLICI